MTRFHGRRVLFPFVLAGLGALVLAHPAPAQLLQGSITGNVTDANQAAVVAARIVATDEQTNFTRDTVSNSSGVYNLPTLPPGTYTVTVTAPSFQTTSVTGVTVSPEQVTRRDVTLTIGQLTQKLTVLGETITLQTDRADVRDELTVRA